MTIREKEWFIEAPWGRLCIVAWGHCYDPPVLVCHGLMDCMASFRPLVEKLPKNFYYIGLELPGNGKSDPFPPGLLMNFYDLVYCADVVVKHFRWKTFTFLGHSAGANVGLLYDFCLPGKISRLILLDPITPPVDPDRFVAWYERSYQKLFDDFDYYNAQKERRTLYTKQEALNNLLKMEGMSKQLAEASLARVTEIAGDGLLRFTSDHRYKLLPNAPLTGDQLKVLCQRSKAQLLVVTTSQSVQQGKYSKSPYLIDGSLINSRTLEVQSHHNLHLDPSQPLVGAVSQFLLHGLEGLGAKARL